MQKYKNYKYTILFDLRLYGIVDTRLHNSSIRQRFEKKGAFSDPYSSFYTLNHPATAVIALWNT